MVLSGFLPFRVEPGLRGEDNDGSSAWMASTDVMPVAVLCRISGGVQKSRNLEMMMISPPRDGVADAVGFSGLDGLLWSSWFVADFLHPAAPSRAEKMCNSTASSEYSWCRLRRLRQSDARYLLLSLGGYASCKNLGVFVVSRAVLRLRPRRRLCPASKKGEATSPQIPIPLPLPHRSGLLNGCASVLNTHSSNPTTSGGENTK